MMKDSILVIGGAGYIGSHMIRVLRDAGYHVIVLDNFCKGHREFVQDFICYEIDLLDPEKLNTVFEKEKIIAVMHFAAFIEVGESVQDPQRYYMNNLVGTVNLLHAMLSYNVKNLIFSSSAAIYGEPQYTPIDEQHIIAPVNPYGKTKAMVEDLLKDYERAYALNYTSLRYFNASGADPHGEVGERHEPETHLIPNVLKSVLGKSHSLKIYGNDFNTPDGTCIRDYIHVLDICSAHLLALEQLISYSGSYCYNLGNGKGYSVKQVIEATMKVVKRPIPYQIHTRRPGDPAVLVADSSLIQRELGWKPKYESLDVIIGDAWSYLSKFE